MSPTNPSAPEGVEPERTTDSEHAESGHESHHVQLPAAFDALGKELAEDTPVEATMLSKAIGGWRGIVDSSLPSLVFLIVYLVNGRVLTPAVWAAVAAAVVIAVWRLFRRQSLQQVLAGLVGVGISAFVAAKTGSAANFFLPGLLINIGYGLAFLLSILVRWPLVGVLLGAATGDLSGWRSNANLRRSYAAATWIWVGMFFLRVIVQVPLYFLDLVGALGVAKIAMGWPLTLFAGWLTYRLVKPAMAEAKPTPAAPNDAPPNDAAKA